MIGGVNHDCGAQWCLSLARSQDWGYGRAGGMKDLKHRHGSLQSWISLVFTAVNYNTRLHRSTVPQHLFFRNRDRDLDRTDPKCNPMLCLHFNFQAFLDPNSSTS